MAVFFTSKHGPLSRVKALLRLPRFNHVAAGSRVEARVISAIDSETAEHIGGVDMSNWKTFNSRCFGISSSIIPQHTLSVLTVLRHSGFDAYLVGGCVRDLVLKRIPKDFDVITSANLQKVKRQFHRSQIVGRRFPICMVRIRGSVVEVSSFKVAKVQNAEFGEKISLPPIPRGCSAKDFMRWRDSMRRDFTVNSLFLDPFNHVIYDYTNAMEDLKSLTLRTLIPAKLSFKEDNARMLRGLRIAARLGLEISEETEDAIRCLLPTIKCLPKDRIMLEINYMLSYGAAEPSLRLLWRFRLLEILLPFQAAYLDQLDEGPSSHSSSMLMKLFSNMDKLVSCGQPSHSHLWIGLLAFHHALVCCPQDAPVVWAFASILYVGWKKGIKFATTSANSRACFVPEISELSSYLDVAELEGRVSYLASLVQKSTIALSDSKILNNTMSRYPLSSYSDLAFVSKRACRNAQRVFQLLVEPSSEGAHDSGAYQEMLRQTGSLMGKIILKTLSDGALAGVETLEMGRGECGKVVMDKQSDRVALDDAAAAEARPRPKKLRATAVLDLAMRKRDLSESGDVSRKRTLLGIWKESEPWHKEAEKQRAAKVQKTVSGNVDKRETDPLEMVKVDRKAKGSHR